MVLFRHSAIRLRTLGRPTDDSRLHLAKQQCIGLAVAAVLCCAIPGCGWIGRLADRRSNLSRQWASEARRAELAGEDGRAERLLRSAIESQKSDAATHRQLAQFLSAQGRHNEAIQEWQIACRLAPDDSRLAVELARAYLKSPHPSRAAGPLADALEANEQDIEALRLLAELAELENRLSDAIENYHRVLQLQPEDFTAKMRLAAIQLRSEHPEQAAPLLRSICQCPLSTAEQQAQALWMLGLAYGREQRWRDAENALARAIEHRPDTTAEDWYRLAYVHFQLHELQAVERDLQQVFALQSEHLAGRVLADRLATIPQAADSRISLAEFERPMSESVHQSAGWPTADLVVPDGW